MCELACERPANRNDLLVANRARVVFAVLCWSRIFQATALCLALLILSSAATAQVGASVSLDSDYRFRARSLSDGNPVATVAISYDDRSGAYTGAAATMALSGQKAGQLVSQSVYAGYARAISSHVDFDLGVSVYRYTSAHSAGRRELFGEVYIGATAGDIAAYVRYSPAYYGRAGPVVYVNIATNSEIAEATRFYTNAGLLIQASGAPTIGGRKMRYDLQTGLAREFGRLTVKAEVAIGGPDDDYFRGVWRGRSSLTIGFQRRF